MSDPQVPMWQQWAQFRFGVVGELLTCPPSHGQLQEALDRLARQHYQHPIDPGRRICFGKSTTLKAQYQAHRRWNVQLHYDNLKALAREQPELGPIPSYKTILRCMRDNGWIRRKEPAQPSDGQQQATQRLENREVRGFEVRHVHGLWHLDFHQAKIRILDSAGKWHRPMALAILDDHSRLCCHLQFYLAETAECLVHGLIQAFMKRGLPRALMTDNAAPMLAEETRQGLKRLAIDHKTTLPDSPYQNGKQEAFWGQLESRLVEVLRGVEDLKLSFMNRAAQAWAEQDYHRSYHKEIKTTHLQRMLNCCDVSRRPPETDALHRAFTPAAYTEHRGAVTAPFPLTASATNCRRGLPICGRWFYGHRSGTKAGWSRSIWPSGTSDGRPGRLCLNQR